jgi:hypothetical protein
MSRIVRVVTIPTGYRSCLHGFSRLIASPMASFCEHGNEPSLLMDLTGWHSQCRTVPEPPPAGCNIRMYNRFYASFAFRIAGCDEYKYSSGEQDEGGKGGGGSGYSEGEVR